MNSIDMPSRVCMSFSSFRICACTVTSSAVVGSSAISRSGLVGERHGDHHALALAAGQLVRIAAEPRLPDRECRPGRAIRRCAARAASPVSPRCSSRISPICFSIVCSGLSEVIGSWKMMVMSLPRTSRISRSGMRQQFAALEHDRAGRMVRRRIGQQLHHRQRRHRLAGAGLADQRHRLALADVERHAVDRQHLAARPAEGDGEIADGEQGFGRARSSERLSRIEGVAHRFADEDQQRQHDARWRRSR